MLVRRLEQGGPLPALCLPVSPHGLPVLTCSCHGAIHHDAAAKALTRAQQTSTAYSWASRTVS